MVRDHLLHAPVQVFVITPADRLSIFSLRPQAHFQVEVKVTGIGLLQIFQRLRILLRAISLKRFQRFQRQSDGIRFGGGRDFAMPIEERRVEERLSGSATGLNLLYYRIELTPKRVGPYISAEKISVSFPLEDLVDGERIRLQPAQYAILQGLKKTELASGLVRILSMDYRKGEFSVELELAQPGE